MKTFNFKHSGTFGDLIYGLPVMKYLGGGNLFLHLNQIDWIGQHFYGSAPSPFHQGRMTQEDFDYMRPLMEAQSYIKSFDTLKSDTEITHNLDRFRVPFVGHPGNYVDIYSKVFGITDPETQSTVRNTPWLTVPKANRIQPVVINRTARWLPGQMSPKWKAWREELEHQSVFVGLPEEYQLFTQNVGWNIPYHQAQDMLELAQIIQGSDRFIGNQSMALSLAIGLGVPYACEARTDLPLDRNECYFPNRANFEYF